MAFLYPARPVPWNTSSVSDSTIPWFYPSGCIGSCRAHERHRSAPHLQHAVIVETCASSFSLFVSRKPRNARMVAWRVLIISGRVHEQIPIYRQSCSEVPAFSFCSWMFGLLARAIGKIPQSTPPARCATRGWTMPMPKSQTQIPRKDCACAAEHMHTSTLSGCEQTLTLSGRFAIARREGMHCPLDTTEGLSTGATT